MPVSPRPEFEPLTNSELPRKPRILPWLRLMRLPNVFTAIADVSMGYLFVQREVTDGKVLGCVIGASACLYTAGMVLNDAFDYQIDAKERPFRPIPSGQISMYWALMLGCNLLTLGIVLGGIAGLLPGAADEMPWRSGLVAIVLALCVLAYDAGLKKTPLGPLAMGSCRSLNVLLGMSVASPAADGVLVGFGRGELLAAAGIGIYIAGVTWFARSEAGTSRAAALAAAMIVMVGGVLLLAMSAYQPLHFHSQTYGRHAYSILLTILTLTVLRRCVVAAFDPVPQKVQAAVKLAIMSLIWFDASTTLVVAGPVYGIAIAVLIVPAFLLGWWVYST